MLNFTLWGLRQEVKRCQRDKNYFRAYQQNAGGDMQQGWIKLYRSIKDHWIYQEKRKFSRYEAWLDLLMKANHQDNKVLIGSELIEVKRGSFITSELKLMKNWGWSKSKVRAFLTLLEEEQMIVKEADNKKTTITICNYNVYQDVETTEKPRKDYGKTSEKQQKDTNKNDKELKNEKNTKYDHLFELFWTIYPKKMAKVDAAKAFNAVIKSGESMDEIMKATKNYAEECVGKDRQYIKHPTTFLRNERWKDHLQKQQQYIDPRDREIALQRWITDGKDPELFRWDE